MACNHCDNCICHENHHEEEKESKLDIYLYLLSIVLFALSFVPNIGIMKIVLTISCILFSGYKLLFSGIKNIFKLNFEENTLMTIAVIAAFCLGEYTEACLVLLLYRIGEFLEDRATDKSQESIEKVVEIKAENANRIVNDEIEVVDIEELKIDDIILIKPGEKIPVDAVVLAGKSEVDTSAITGESKSAYVTENNELLSGSINLTGALTCKVIRDAKNSTASQIVDLVYEAVNNKGNTEKFITRFSKIYTPTVIILAIILATVPALIGILDCREGINRALIFLVASCPCSLVIAVPLSFFSCIGVISKKGMIIKGTKHIENLSKATTIAFDKTGTLTTGDMEIDKIQVYEPFSENDVIKFIYSLELLSNHPISTAIKKYNKNIEKCVVEDYKEISGCGLYGKIDNKEILFGNKKLLDKYNINTDKLDIEEGIYLAVDGNVACYITLKEEIRKEAKDIIDKLKKVGIKRIVMLTGDNKISAEKIAKEIGIKEVDSSLLPKDKLDRIEKLKAKGEKVIFVGDGINDGPVLASSDFGIAMGVGSEIAGTTADSILISNNIGTIPNIIKTSKKSMNIIKFNIAFSIIIKIIVLILGSMGKAPIWAAIFADTGVTFLTVLNAMRIFKL